MVSASFAADAIVRDPIVVRPTGTITAGETAIHILVDVPDGAPIRYYVSIEHASHDAARSEVFSSTDLHNGRYEWQGWIPPVTGGWTVHIREDDGDASVDSSSLTVA